MGTPATTTWTRRDPVFFTPGSLVSLSDPAIAAKIAAFPAGFLDAVSDTGHSQFPHDGLLSTDKTAWAAVELLETDDFPEFGSPNYIAEAAPTLRYFPFDQMRTAIDTGAPNNRARLPPAGSLAFGLTDVWFIGYIGPLYILARTFLGPSDPTAVHYTNPHFPAFILPTFDNSLDSLAAAIGGSTADLLIVYSLTCDQNPKFGFSLPTGSSGAFTFVSLDPAGSGLGLYVAHASFFTVMGLARMPVGMTVPLT